MGQFITLPMTTASGPVMKHIQCMPLSSLSIPPWHGRCWTSRMKGIMSVCLLMDRQVPERVIRKFLFLFFCISLSEDVFLFLLIIER